MTEPLFIALSLVCLVGLLRFSRNKGLGTLVWAAVVAGLAVFTRLIGLGLVIAGVGFLLIGSPGKFRQRLYWSVLFFTISIIPAVIWLIQSSTVGEGTFNRSILFHPMSTELVKGYFLFLGDWIQLHRLFSGEYRLLLAVFLAAAGPLLFLIGWFRDGRAGKVILDRTRDSAIWLLLIYSLTYVITLYINSTFIDASTTPYAPERYVTSIYPIFVMLILLTYYRVLERIERKTIVAVIFAVLAAGIVFLQGRVTWQAVSQGEIPLGYIDFIRESPVLVLSVQENARSSIIYSNNPELTYAISGVGAYILPFQYNSATGLEIPAFDQEVEEMVIALSNGARIIHYGGKDEQQSRLYRLLDLQTVLSFPEGEIYQGR
jgi:4-amino-4-deoxy-L-arabinose transferase-like glycosyltransferase